MKPQAFIVHGRDLQAVAELVKFLNALGIEHRTFEDVASDGTAPFVADVVVRGIIAADVVIALFTPDEQAALYDPATGAYQGDKEGESRWQARPNVIFEAGVALGIARDRTILATLGADVRLFSDLSGVHFIALDRPTAKKLLYDKLRKLLPAAVLDGKAVANPKAGNFQRVLRRRWQHYDEIALLEEYLVAQKVGRNRVSLYDILVSVVAAEPPDRLKRLSPEAAIRAVKEAFGEGTADSAYWWFVVYGVFQFKDTERWYSGDRWTGSVRNVVISDRGWALLQKLRIAHTTA